MARCELLYSWVGANCPPPAGWWLNLGSRQLPSEAWQSSAELEESLRLLQHSLLAPAPHRPRPKPLPPSLCRVPLETQRACRHDVFSLCLEICAKWNKELNRVEPYAFSCCC